MPSISTSYIHERQHAIHSYDSFGRALCDSVLESAKKKLGSGTAEQVTIDGLKATIQPYQGTKDLVCVEVCIDTPFGRICKHVGI